jgi:hypothetical protein
LRFLLLAGAFALGAAARAEEFVAMSVDPPAVRLRGPRERWTLLVTGRTPDGRLVDRTHAARFLAADPGVVRVGPTGSVTPVADGHTSVAVEADGRTLAVAVDVEGMRLPRRFDFGNDVEPLLARFGCNSSGCHGKAEGQNGFKLSVFGSDPAADFAALTQESRGRRVFPAAPEQSLLLRKVSGRVAHGGGVRIRTDSPEYETLLGWIATGVPFGAPDEPGVVAVRVEPHERVLDPGGRQRLRVVAHWADGRETDVTAHARFQANNEPVARVLPDGLVRAGDVPGVAAVMAGYLNAVDTFRVVVPRPGRLAGYPCVPENNFIDTLVFRELRKLNIVPSGLADDAEFLRRVHLDVVGALPTAAEARRFLADRRPDKRARLVDELLRRPEHADLWALYWADVLRVDRAALGPKRAYAYYRWLRDSFAAGRPFDEIARELITAEGPIDEAPAAAFYQAAPQPGSAASSVAQAFLGVRIACAECHHHPYDRWTQDDYSGMQAFFVPLHLQPSAAGDALLGEGAAVARNPRTGRDVPAHPLGEAVPRQAPAGDARAALAAWVTRTDNPFFARNVANRVWAHLMGRGLVEPVDDVRATNPPTNPELIDALARFLVEHRYDTRALVRLIAASRAYQLSSRPNATNECDEQNYSRARLRRVPAEVLLDMVSQATGVPERFEGTPPGTRAVQLWDSKVNPYFLKVFGRPQRVSACACERQEGPSVAQVLHLMNSPRTQARLAHEDGRVARLVRRGASDGELVEELYLTCFSRFPTEEEKRAAVEYLAGKPDRRRAAEDLAWGLLNSLEFVFNH